MNLVHPVNRRAGSSASIESFRAWVWENSPSMAFLYKVGIAMPNGEAIERIESKNRECLVLQKYRVFLKIPPLRLLEECWEALYRSMEL